MTPFFCPSTCAATLSLSLSHRIRNPIHNPRSKEYGGRGCGQARDLGRRGEAEIQPAVVEVLGVRRDSKVRVRIMVGV